MKSNSKWAGLAAAACILWGISGLFAKGLFNLDPRITPIWVTQMRQVCSGLILLTVAQLTGKHPWQVWKDKKSAVQLLAYAVIGVLPFQYCFFLVVAQANAAIATVIQFIGPFFVLAYLTLTNQEALRPFDVAASLLAFGGVFLLSTHGNIHDLRIAPLTLLFGIMSAVGAAANSLLPQALVTRQSTISVTGWGLLISGLILTAIPPIWPSLPSSPTVYLNLSVVIVMGTIIPTLWQNHALGHISGMTVAFMDAFEPLASMIGSIIVFHFHPQMMDYAASVMIIFAVLALNWTPRSKIKARVEK